MAKDDVETVYVHAENATIEAPFPVKTKMGHKYKPGLPGVLAICRFQVGDDLAAAAILLRLKWRWRQKTKLQRFGKEWVAESRWHWAIGSGLTWHEFVKRGLPRLRKCEFVIIRQMKLGQKKLLWMHLDETKLPQPSGPNWEYFVKRMIGVKVMENVRADISSGHRGTQSGALDPKKHWPSPVVMRRTRGLRRASLSR